MRARLGFPAGASEAARLSTVRDLHKHISPDDTLYFVMTFIERAGEHIVADLQRKGDEIRSAISGAAVKAEQRCDSAKDRLMAAELELKASALHVGSRLSATAAHVVKELAKERDIVIPSLKKRFIADLTGQGGELDQVRSQLRVAVSEEVRLALKNAFAKESAALRQAMTGAEETLRASTTVVNARARNGLVENLIDDVKALAADGRYVTISGSAAGVIFVIYWLMRILTELFR